MQCLVQIFRGFRDYFNHSYVSKSSPRKSLKLNIFSLDMFIWHCEREGYSCEGAESIVRVK